MNDPLNRPIAQHLIPQAAAAGDLILATFRQRLMAFCIDAIIISSIYTSIIFSCTYYGIKTIPFLMLFCMIWGGYVIGFSASKLSATLGQKLMHIHLYSLFSGGINFTTAFTRFILISYPTLIGFAACSDLLYELLPLERTPTQTTDENLGYTILAMASLMQIALLLPLIFGNYRNVSWDKTLRCCVIKQKIWN